VKPVVSFQWTGFIIYGDLAAIEALSKSRFAAVGNPRSDDLEVTVL
jgi:hypothetical protein